MEDVQGGEGSTRIELDSKKRFFLSQIAQDIRTTASNLKLPKVTPLSTVDANAVNAIKDLFYIINNEDPLNAMPARCFVFELNLVKRYLIPIIAAVDTDPASQTNQKRWSIPIYQTLRALSVLSTPISDQNDSLKSDSSLDNHLIQLCADLAESRQALQAIVSLLQYYIERKTEKQIALAPAEQSKLEDARIDNILRFFRNLLAPPRTAAGSDVLTRDKSVHLALVGSLVKADLYSTINIFFSSKEESAGQFTDLVFLAADIYAQTFRHTNPRQMYDTYRKYFASSKPKIEMSEKKETTETKKPAEKTSVFDEPYDKPSEPIIAPQKEIKKPSRKPSIATSLRAAIQRERSTVGGSRALAPSARWTSRHSGGVSEKKKSTTTGRSTNGNTASNTTTSSAQDKSNVLGISTSSGISQRKRIISAQAAIQSTLSFNPRRPLQDQVRVNSDILCLNAAKKRASVFKREHANKKVTNAMRRDLQTEGLRGLVSLASELIDDSFGCFLRELRHRIQDVKERSAFDEMSSLKKANHSFLTITAAVVGFQRERFGKIYKNSLDDTRPLNADIHENNMKAVLASDFKIVRTEWRAVDSAIELESFQLVFSILVESFDNLKKNGKSEIDVNMVELATSSILQMMKLLQGMATVNDNKGQERVESPENVDSENKKLDLTPRELALNILEQLFEREAFLNASADLAREYCPKTYSFKHLTNVVEVAHAFTTILLDEEEFAKLQVNRKKRVKRKKKIEEDPEGEGEGEGDQVKEPDNVPKESENQDEIDKPKEGDINNEEDESGSIEKKESNSEENTSMDTEQIPTEVDHIESSTKSPEKPSVKELLQADVEVERRRLKAKSVMKVTKDSGTKPADNDETKQLAEELGDSDTSDSDDGLPELREIESIGIVRKFANFKAIDSLLLPIRVAICENSTLSGKAYPIPEGSNPLLHPVITAKSAHVLAAIWRVAKIQERGVHCGQFFSYGIMHLVALVQSFAKEQRVLPHSVLERFATFGKDVTSVFFKWLAINPGLSLDLFFVMDRMSCQMHISYMRDRDEMLRRSEKGGDESGTESDLSLVNCRVPAQTERRPSLQARKKKSKEGRISEIRKNSMHERRRAERDRIEDDEDVDDLDNLDIGVDAPSDSEDVEKDSAAKSVGEKDGSVEKNQDDVNPGQERKETDANSGRTSESDNPTANKKSNNGTSQKKSTKRSSRLTNTKRRRVQQFDPFASDDELFERVRENRQRKKPKKKSKQSEKTKKVSKAVEKQFSSSDEYNEAELLLAGAEPESAEEIDPITRPISKVAQAVHDGLKDFSDGETQAPDVALKTTLAITDGDGKSSLAGSVYDSEVEGAEKKESDVDDKEDSVDHDNGPSSERLDEIPKTKPRKKIVVSDEESD